MAGCGTHNYDNISRQEVDAILEALQDDGATITGDNPWDVETVKHRIKLRGVWKEESLTLAVTVTDHNSFIPCFMIWANIDALMQHIQRVSATETISETITETTPAPKVVHFKRMTILPKEKIDQPKISWTSWVLLVVMLAACFALFWYTYGLVLRGWVRGIVTCLWVSVTIVLAIVDFFKYPGGVPGQIDSIPVDRWTLSHCGSGLVFGVWYLPLWVVLALACGWEVFEIKVVGFGDKEIWKNRVVDIGVAVVCWFFVVITAMGTGIHDPYFPFLRSLSQ